MLQKNIGVRQGLIPDKSEVLPTLPPCCSRMESFSIVGLSQSRVENKSLVLASQDPVKVLEMRVLGHFRRALWMVYIWSCWDEDSERRPLKLREPLRL